MSNAITIIGKPNVGKSTLFNRLVKKNIAIVNKKIGTTRDRKYGYSEWTGKKFIVIDTGGYIYKIKNKLEKEINNQIKIAIKKANIILFLVNYQDGLLPIDISLSNQLRKYNKIILLVINKTDNYKSIKFKNFHQIGIKNIYYISAINGYGIGNLLDKIIIYLKKKKKKKKKIPKISILGKPNVGKSSFLNIIMKEKRSIVLNNAGTTRDSINSYYNLYNKKFIIIDTAGIRKKGKIKKNIEFYSVIKSIKALENSDICIVIIDAQNGMESQDINIIKLATKYKKGIVIAINKWDLCKNVNIKIYKRKILKKIENLNYIPIIFISTIEKKNIYETIEKSLEIYNNKNKKLSTNKINNILIKSIIKKKPGFIGKKSIKIKYITQLPISNPTFILFCNFPEYIQNSYKNYLRNKIRKNFKLEGININLIFRKKN